MPEKRKVMIGLKPKKKTKNVQLYDIFIGEKVQIVTTTRIKRTEQREDTLFEEERPLVYEVFFLDMDEEFYYVGGKSDKVSSAIAKDHVESIHILYEVDALDLVFDEHNDKDSKLN